MTLHVAHPPKCTTCMWVRTPYAVWRAPLERRPQHIDCLLLRCCCSGTIIRYLVGYPTDPRCSLFLFLFLALAIPRQSTGARNFMQASVGHTTDDRVRSSRERYIDKRTRGRAIVPLEYDCVTHRRARKKGALRGLTTIKFKCGRGRWSVSPHAMPAKFLELSVLTYCTSES
jgi:hypothetical protein